MIDRQRCTSVGRGGSRREVVVVFSTGAGGAKKSKERGDSSEICLAESLTL